MTDSVLPDVMEQVSDAEMLACVLYKMIYEGDDECLVADEGPVVSQADIALMLCEVTRANRLVDDPSPATKRSLIAMQASLAIYRARNRGYEQT